MLVTVPLSADVSANNQAIFEKLKSEIGFVPNLYAAFAHSEHALGNYLALQAATSSLNPREREREVVVLAVSEVNNCMYSLSAHTVIAKRVGFTDEQIIALRQGTAPFDPKLDTLARLVRNVTNARGHADPALLDRFSAAGFTNENLVDMMMVIGDRTISSYLFNTIGVPIDFPPAPSVSG